MAVDSNASALADTAWRAGRKPARGIVDHARHDSESEGASSARHQLGEAPRLRTRANRLAPFDQ